MTEICSLVDTDYGKMLVPTHDFNQTQAIISTKRGVHHDTAMRIANIIKDRPPGQVFVDGGANLGSFTMCVAPYVTDDGWIHAFEPQPVICNMLAGSVALTQRRNIRVHNVALSDMDGWIEVPQFDYRSGLNFGSIEFGSTVQLETLNQARGDDPAKVEYVRQHKLDSYRLKRLDVLKLDVQRMEYEAIRGALETIIRCQPIMFVEWVGHDKEKMEKYLGNIGYRIIGETQDDFICEPT